MNIIDIGTSVVRHHTSSETKNFAKTLRGYACGKDLRAYRQYFISFSKHCSVPAIPFPKGTVK